LSFLCRKAHKKIKVNSFNENYTALQVRKLIMNSVKFSEIELKAFIRTVCVSQSRSTFDLYLDPVTFTRNVRMLVSR